MITVTEIKKGANVNANTIGEVDIVHLDINYVEYTDVDIFASVKSIFTQDPNKKEVFTAEEYASVPEFNKVYAMKDSTAFIYQLANSFKEIKMESNFVPDKIIHATLQIPYLIDETTGETIDTKSIPDRETWRDMFNLLGARPRVYIIDPTQILYSLSNPEDYVFPEVVVEVDNNKVDIAQLEDIVAKQFENVTAADYPQFTVYQELIKLLTIESENPIIINKIKLSEIEKKTIPVTAYQKTRTFILDKKEYTFAGRFIQNGQEDTGIDTDFNNRITSVDYPQIVVGDKNDKPIIGCYKQDETDQNILIESDLSMATSYTVYPKYYAEDIITIKGKALDDGWTTSFGEVADIKAFTNKFTDTAGKTLIPGLDVTSLVNDIPDKDNGAVFSFDPKNPLTVNTYLSLTQMTYSVSDTPKAKFKGGSATVSLDLLTTPEGIRVFLKGNTDIKKSQLLSQGTTTNLDTALLGIDMTKIVPLGEPAGDPLVAPELKVKNLVMDAKAKSILIVVETPSIPQDFATMAGKQDSIVWSLNKDKEITLIEGDKTTLKSNWIKIESAMTEIVTGKEIASTEVSRYGFFKAFDRHIGYEMDNVKAIINSLRMDFQAKFETPQMDSLAQQNPVNSEIGFVEAVILIHRLLDSWMLGYQGRLNDDIAEINVPKYINYYSKGIKPNVKQPARKMEQWKVELNCVFFNYLKDISTENLETYSKISASGEDLAYLLPELWINILINRSLKNFNNIIFRTQAEAVIVASIRSTVTTIINDANRQFGITNSRVFLEDVILTNEYSNLGVIYVNSITVELRRKSALDNVVVVIQQTYDSPVNRLI